MYQTVLHQPRSQGLLSFFFKMVKKKKKEIRPWGRGLFCTVCSGRERESKREKLLPADKDKIRYVSPGDQSEQPSGSPVPAQKATDQEYRYSPWMGCQSIVDTPPSIFDSQVALTIRRYPFILFILWIERGHARVTCLAQEHNTMTQASARTRIAWSGVQRAKHQGTVLPTI